MFSSPMTPVLVWVGVWPFLFGAAWLTAYELYAAFISKGTLPTISSLVIPNILANPVLSFVLLAVWIGFQVWLFGFDWFRTFIR